jgi:hypothetical protein
VGLSKFTEGATVIPRTTQLQITVQLALESVSRCPWNHCPACRGISVQFLVESLSSWAWNTHAKHTIANLSHWDPQLVEHFRVLLKGGVAVPSGKPVFTIERTLPHGHVAAVLGAARGCGSMQWFAGAPSSVKPVLMAMLVARVIDPASKLATHRMLQDETATSSLGRVLDVGQCGVEELYRALDRLSIKILDCR